MKLKCILIAVAFNALAALSGRLQAAVTINDVPGPEFVAPSRPHNEIWIEGESTASQVGGSVVANGADYGGSAWVLDTATSGTYYASYSFAVSGTGTYALMIAGSPVGATTSSPISYSVDNGTMTATGSVPVSAATWNGINWNSVALVNLSTAGNHSIKIQINQPRASDGRYFYTIDAMALVWEPFESLFSVDANFGTVTWSGTASASSQLASYAPANAMDGDSSTGWVSNTAASTNPVLQITFPTTRFIDAVRLVKTTVPAGSGALDPVGYDIELLEGGIWKKRVSETANSNGDVTYPFPALVRATAIRLTVTSVSGADQAKLPFVNLLEAYGPFAPNIAVGNTGDVFKNGTSSRFRGVTQPGGSITLRQGAATPTIVIANSDGWFLGDQPLVSGTNSVTWQATLSSKKSVRITSYPTLNTSASNSLIMTDRRGVNIAIKEGSGGYLVVKGNGQGAVSYTLSTTDNPALTTGTLDLTKGSDLVPITQGNGWYQLAMTGSTSAINSISINDSNFTLPTTSRVASDVAISQTYNFVGATIDDFRDHISDALYREGIGYVRDRISWNGANPTLNNYNWTNYDLTTNAENAQGQKVLACVYAPAAYLNSAHLANRLPDNLLDTYNWGVTLATHFRYRIAAYEFLNEADYDMVNYTQSGGKLAAHQRAFYLGIKDGDSRALVLPAPPAATRDVDAQLRHMRDEAFDAYSFHWYPPGLGSTGVDQLVNPSYLAKDVASVINSVGNRATWMSESGFFGTQDATTQNLSAADEVFQADYYAKLYPQAIALGIDRPFAFVFPYWNRLNKTQQLGMLRYQNYNPTPAVNTLAAVSYFLKDATYIGALQTGTSAVTGYVFQSKAGDYRLALWASADNTPFTLPGGVTTSLIYDYQGRVTYSGVAKSALGNIPKKAQYLFLTGSNVTGVTTPANDPYAASPESGVAPSRLVMCWHFSPDLPVSRLTNAYTDYLDIAASGTHTTTVNATVEVVNLGSTSFTGPISAYIDSSLWSVSPAQSASITVPAMGSTTVSFTITAPTVADVARLQAQAAFGGLTSRAAENLRTTGTGLGALPVIEPLVPLGNIDLSATACLHNTYGYDAASCWQVASDATVGDYMTCLPDAGLAWGSTNAIKAPKLTYQVHFDFGSHPYYVWVKAMAGSPGLASSRVNVEAVLSSPSASNAWSIGGFNAGAWSWSKTRVDVAGNPVGPASVGIGSAGVYTINIYPYDDGVKIDRVLFTSSATFIPTN